MAIAAAITASISADVGGREGEWECDRDGSRGGRGRLVSCVFRLVVEIGQHSQQAQEIVPSTRSLVPRSSDYSMIYYAPC